jgi:hypothetical protein
LKATAPLNKSASSNQDGMADGNTSAISPIAPVSAPKASASAPAAPVSARRTSTVESAGFISGIVIAGVLALAVLVALALFMRRKLNSSRTVQPPGKTIVRFRSGPCFEGPDEGFFALSSMNS